MHEIPLLALAERKHVAKQLFGLGAVQEVLLIRCALIGVSRRHRNADTKLGGEVEEFRDLLCRVAVENRGVDVDGEAARFRSLDRGHRAIEHALLRHRFVVVLAQTVEMHREEQIGRGLEQIELLLQKQRIGAERNEFLALDQTAHDLADLLVDQRFPAGNGDHRRAALIGGIPTFLRRHAAIEDRVRIVDLAATGASEVATEQRLQHQNKRVALPAKQSLLDQIAADTHFLEERYSHYTFKTFSLSCCHPAASSAGSRNSMFSSRPGSTDTLTGPMRRRASITSSTSTSGAEAPAVMPTVFAFLNHSGLSSLPSAIR